MRIGQGIGGGLLQPIGMAMGFWSIAAAASVSLGPML